MPNRGAVLALRAPPYGHRSLDVWEHHMRLLLQHVQNLNPVLLRLMRRGVSSVLI